MISPLTIDQLYRACNPQALRFSSTDELESMTEIVGQERALKAIQFAINMPHQGYNLYVMGSPGYGRHQLTYQTILQQAQSAPTPPDLCYAANFKHPTNPVALMLPAGRGFVLREMMESLIAELQQLNREFSEQTIIGLTEKIEEEFDDLKEVREHLLRVRQHLIENIPLFRRKDDHPAPVPDPNKEPFKRYRINLLVDNSDSVGSPIIHEDNPTYNNVIGQIEQIAQMGTLTTDCTHIKPGALHRANGGYLILDIEKLLADPDTWNALKRALQRGKACIEPRQLQMSQISTIALEPQPSELNVKIILIGDHNTYFDLKETDGEFDLLFKVTADLSGEMRRDRKSEALYARLIATLVSKEGLLPLDTGAVARVIEENARRVWDGEKLSLRLGGVLDLLREANYQALRDDSPIIETPHVDDAINDEEYRSDQLREQVIEQILRGTIKIDTAGIQLSQVNGLTIVQMGDLAFGAPTRISATARLGNGEVVDISRESYQGGPIHSKGVMILASYLAERYAKHQPLSLSASLVFEQTYGMVEGDSASAAELCALLSALSDVPITQSMAITGSINQRGEIQAIGGVCQKIEGFFEICSARGLDGSHAVIIPAANVKDLMLRPAVLQAAEQDLFKIYAVHHINEAMELLTGLESGHQNAEGIYPEASINGRIQFRLAQWIGLRQYFNGQLQEEIQEEITSENTTTPENK